MKKSLIAFAALATIAAGGGDVRLALRLLEDAIKDANRWRR